MTKLVSLILQQLQKEMKEATEVAQEVRRNMERLKTK